jgi:NAD(P)-dependent dehydrogenase (short-subunit alcohol dehydrogenase family)
VTVNNFAPGAILAARNRDQMEVEGEARPDDLAGAAMLLCSDAGSYINEADLFVDCGRAANLLATRT